MRRAPSALLLIGGFGVAVATLSVGSTAAVVLLAPEPPALRMSTAAAVEALRGDKAGYERRIISAPPSGVRATLIEQMLAAELKLAPADVRAVWLEGALPPRTFRLDQRNRELAQAPLPKSFVLVGRPNGTFRMVATPATSEAMRRTFLNVPMPDFVASVRGQDGQWLSVEPTRPILQSWQRNILIALAVSLLLLAPLAWFFARRLTRPFRALAGALGDTRNTIPHEGPRELREAAAAIATMRASLAEEATERARMLTAIAHDLRTPLTGLRLRIEASPESQRARMVEDVERMQAMIGEVLTFAREAAAPDEIVAVRPVLSEVAADLGVGGATIRLLPGPEAHIAAPASAFRRAIENLVRNAVDYAGGCFLDARVDGTDVIMSVADDGPGIRDEDRERLLRPFERGEASRNRATGGAGLGLSIVRDFAAQNHGKFTLAQADGGGTVATLRLPVA